MSKILELFASCCYDTRINTILGTLKWKASALQALCSVLVP